MDSVTGVPAIVTVSPHRLRDLVVLDLFMVRIKVRLVKPVFMGGVPLAYGFGRVSVADCDVVISGGENPSRLGVSLIFILTIGFRYGVKVEISLIL